MKPNTNSIITAVTIFFTVFLISCKKETSLVVKQDKNSQPLKQTISEEASASSVNTVYYSCGMSVNVFTPNPILNRSYSLAYKFNNSQIQSFGIDTYGQINLSNPDKFHFEFAGYADAAQTVKTWRIKRIDGKYLTANNGFSYLNKITGSQASQQIFLLSSLGNNVYKLLLPKLPVCNIAAIWLDIDTGWEIYNFAYDNPELNIFDTKIIMIANGPRQTMDVNSNTHHYLLQIAIQVQKHW